MTGRRQGPRRLGLLLSTGSGLLCLVMRGVVLAAYGTPFNPYWWVVMAVIALAAIMVPWLVVPLVDWVIAGYRADIEAGRSRSGAGSAD